VGSIVCAQQRPPLVRGGLSVASIAISTPAMLKNFVAQIVVDEKCLF
jgi:hypothetical protein